MIINPKPLQQIKANKTACAKTESLPGGNKDDLMVWVERRGPTIAVSTVGKKKSKFPCE
jgi:hypothetical protein